MRRSIQAENQERTVAAGFDHKLMFSALHGVVRDNVLDAAFSNIPTGDACRVWVSVPTDMGKKVPCNGVPSVVKIMASQPGSHSN